jgi:hypothetical protein
MEIIMGGGIIGGQASWDPTEDDVILEMARAMGEVDGHDTSNWTMPEGPIPDSEPATWSIIREYVRAARKQRAAHLVMERTHR